MEEHVGLGDLVKDPITGITGILVSRTEFLFNCVRVCVTAQTLDKDGKEQTYHFDIAQLELVEAKKINPNVVHNLPRPPGGPERISSPVASGSPR